MIPRQWPTCSLGIPTYHTARFDSYLDTISNDYPSIPPSQGSREKNNQKRVRNFRRGELCTVLLQFTKGFIRPLKKEINNDKEFPSADGDYRRETIRHYIMGAHLHHLLHNPLYGHQGHTLDVGYSNFEMIDLFFFEPELLWSKGSIAILNKSISIERFTHSASTNIFQKNTQKAVKCTILSHRTHLDIISSNINPLRHQIKIGRTFATAKITNERVSLQEEREMCSPCSSNYIESRTLIASPTKFPAYWWGDSQTRWWETAKNTRPKLKKLKITNNSKNLKKNIWLSNHHTSKKDPMQRSARTVHIWTWIEHHSWRRCGLYHPLHDPDFRHLHHLLDHSFDRVRDLSEPVWALARQLKIWNSYSLGN